MNLKAALAGAVGLVVCTMSWAPQAFAAEHATVDVVKLDPKLKYKTSDAEQSAETDSFLADIIVKFASHDLYAIPMQSAQGPNILTMSRADIAFGSENLDHMIFVKTGVKLSDEKAVGKLLRMPHGVYSYHKVTKSGLPVAVIFTGFSEQEAVDTAGSVLVAANAPVHSSSFVATVFNSLIPSACAAANPKDCLPASGASKGVKITAESVKAIADKVILDDSPKATAARMIMECATSALVGVLYATKPGATVGGALLVAGGAALAIEGAKALYADWSGSVAKVSESVQKTAKAVSTLVNEVKNEVAKSEKAATGKSDGKTWTSLMNKGDLAAELVCGVIGGLPKGTLAKILNGGLEATGIGGVFAKVIQSPKLAKFFPKKAASAEAVALREEGAATTAAAAKADDTAEVAAAAGKSEVKGSDFAQKNAVQFHFADDAKLKSSLVQAGVKEAEAAPVLETVSKAASGKELGTEERTDLIQKFLTMNPEKRKVFQSEVLKVVDTNALPATSGAKFAGRSGRTSFAPKNSVQFKLNLEKEFKHAERAVQVKTDPTQYPSLQKLSLTGKDELAVIDVVVAAEERGIPKPRINQAVEDAKAACAAK
jgi:hypothetical protein